MNKPNLTVFDHPLISHKISILRNENTGSKQFRELIEEIAMLMGFEAMRDLPTQEIEVKTPITVAKTKVIAGKKLAVVPILRAGLGMVGGLLALVPSAKVGHIGLYRDPVTHEPHEYYCKLPEDIDKRLVIIAAPEGIERLTSEHPDVEIYCGCVDECLNENKYIIPGLGDAGDRIFGTL